MAGSLGEEPQFLPARLGAAVLGSQPGCGVPFPSGTMGLRHHHPIPVSSGAPVGRQHLARGEGRVLVCVTPAHKAPPPPCWAGV